MYYILFNYTEGLKAKDFYATRSEDGVIEFLHNHYEGIEIIHVIEAKAAYRLGLVVTANYVKSELEPKEEAEGRVELGTNAEEILKENKGRLVELEEREPSAMEKVIDDAEKEIEEEAMTPEEKTEKVLDDADQLIAREKEREKQKKKGWKLCTKCNSNRVAPWNKKKICSRCQSERKTTRPYARHKEFKGL